MAAQPVTHLSPEEYLTLDRQREYKTDVDDRSATVHFISIDCDLALSDVYFFVDIDVDE